MTPFGLQVAEWCNKVAEDDPEAIQGCEERTCRSTLAYWNETHLGEECLYLASGAPCRSTIWRFYSVAESRGPYYGTPQSHASCTELCVAQNGSAIAGQLMLGSKDAPQCRLSPKGALQLPQSQPPEPAPAPSIVQQADKVKGANSGGTRFAVGGDAGACALLTLAAGVVLLAAGV